MIYLILILILGGLRFHDLLLKPVHHDESINGNFVSQIWSQGWFTYDPNNYHGPLLFYFFAFAERCFGWGVYGYRFVTVMFSVMQVLLLWWWLKRRVKAGSWQLIPILLSPGLTFFARSAIHETVFVFFLSLLLIGVLEVFHYAPMDEGEESGTGSITSKRGWAMIVWGLFGALALKETWILLVGAGGLAYLILLATRQVGNPFTAWKKTETEGLFGHSVAALTGLFFLYSGWMVNQKGLLDFFFAYLPWMKTGLDESGHKKAWTYWAGAVYRQEIAMAALFALCLFLGARYFKKMSPAVRWLYLTSIIHFAVYSLIPYKTPWCIVACLIPCMMATMAVWGELVLLKFPLRRTAALLIVGLSVYGAKIFWDINFVRPTQLGHEYIYVQTDTRLGGLVNFLYEKAKKEPGFRSARIQVAGSENWPMAWWLGGFPNRIHQSVQSGIVPNADVIIADATEAAKVEAAINPVEFIVAEFPIRDGRENSRWYLRKSTFPQVPSAGGYSEIAHSRIPAVSNPQSPAN